MTKAKTKLVQYSGTSDVQEFSKADFAKAGVEQNMLRFRRGEAVEVPSAVADALLSPNGVFGGYSFDEMELVEEASDNATP